MFGYASALARAEAVSVRKDRFAERATEEEREDGHVGRAERASAQAD